MDTNVIFVSLPLQQFTALLKDTLQQCLNEIQISEDQQLNTEQICKLLNVSDVTLMKWRKAGKIPFMQEGRKIIYNKKEVLESLKK